MQMLLIKPSLASSGANLYCVLKIRLICKSRCRRRMAISRRTVIIKFGNLCSCFYGLWVTDCVMRDFAFERFERSRLPFPCYQSILNSGQPCDAASASFNSSEYSNFRVASLAIWRELRFSNNKKTFSHSRSQINQFCYNKTKRKILNWPLLFSSVFYCEIEKNLAVSSALTFLGALSQLATHKPIHKFGPK